MPNFHEFAAELESLCHRHGICLVPTVAGGIGVWQVGRRPATLVDCLIAGNDGPLDLPVYFDSTEAAQEHPGIRARIVRAFDDQDEARRFSMLMPDAKVIPLWPPENPTHWVVAWVPGHPKAA